MGVVAGGAFSHSSEIVSQAVPAATSQIHRRHMRTRLSRIYCKVKYIRRGFFLFFFKHCTQPSIGPFLYFFQYSFLSSFCICIINFHLWSYTVISYRIMLLIKSLFHNLLSPLMCNPYLLKPCFKRAVPIS